jgi:D-alanyl-lipoteichoic acid acyltransferase DltB (MBOAT superfamily)
MITFFVSGFWHGAGWTFVAWGLLNGVFVCSAAWMKRRNLRFPLPLAVLLTFIGVIVLRVLFVSSVFTDAWQVYRGMVNFASIRENGFVIANFSVRRLVTLISGLAICWFVPNSGKLADKFKISWLSLLFSGLLIGLCMLQMNNGAPFLYFQF